MDNIATPALSRPIPAGLLQHEQQLTVQPQTMQTVWSKSLNRGRTGGQGFLERLPYAISRFGVKGSGNAPGDRISPNAGESKKVDCSDDIEVLMWEAQVR